MALKRIKSIKINLFFFFFKGDKRRVTDSERASLADIGYLLIWLST